MILHPLLLSVMLMDLLGLLFLGAAAISAMRIVAGWQAGSASFEQIRLERRFEASSIQGRCGLLLMLLSTLVLVAAIAIVLPRMVPGAMCGTGVMQATGGSAGRALFLRGLALCLLCAWHLLDRLNRKSPESPLATGAARSLLLASPVAFVAVLETFRAIFRLDVHRPVDCCAVVYDRVQSLTEGTSAGGIPDSFWVWGLAAGSILLILFGLLVVGSRPAGSRKRAPVLAFVAVFWVPVAWMALVKVLSAYHYGVLAHSCPWCLFLPEHNLVGYPVFASLAVVGLEGPAAFLASRISSRVPALKDEATQRVRQAGWHATLAALLFLCLTGLPALVWRFRFGVWMG